MSQAVSGGGGRSMGKPMRSGEGNIPFSKMVFDGKRMRKAIQRRTVDYNHSLTRWMQVRISYSTRSIVLVNNKETCMTMNVSIATENMLNDISFFLLSLCNALVCSISLIWHTYHRIVYGYGIEGILCFSGQMPISLWK